MNMFIVEKSGEYTDTLRLLVGEFDTEDQTFVVVDIYEFNSNQHSWVLNDIQKRYGTEPFMLHRTHKDAALGKAKTVKGVLNKVIQGIINGTARDIIYL